MCSRDFLLPHVVRLFFMFADRSPKRRRSSRRQHIASLFIIPHVQLAAYYPQYPGAGDLLIVLVQRISFLLRVCPSSTSGHIRRGRRRLPITMPSSGTRTVLTRSQTSWEELIAMKIFRKSVTGCCASSQRGSFQGAASYPDNFRFLQARTETGTTNLEFPASWSNLPTRTVSHDMLISTSIEFTCRRSTATR